jgi:RNA polymerase sigma-70 factor (ECF subfamily)
MAMTDEEIALRVIRGDAEAFGFLMERYEAKLTRYGRRFLSDRDDVAGIVQDVFVRAYQNLQSFDLTQRFSPWIYRIAHNALVSELRGKGSRPSLLPDFDTLLAHVPSEEEVGSDTDRREMQKLIERGLSELAPKHREALILYYLEDLSYKEMADVLQVPIGTIAIRLSRAKKALKTVYDRLNVTYE